MLLRAVWVIGRGVRGNATLAHALVDGTASETLCRVEVTDWSRSFVPDQLMRYLDHMKCKRCSASVAAQQVRASRAA
jgi:hypothetical protein